MTFASEQSSATAVATPAPDATRPKPRQQPPYHVILLDDDDHSYDYVIRMMQTLFGHPVERGYLIAQQVDKAGRAICGTFHKELAELRQEQVHGFGKDPLMARCAGPMSAIIEPALSGDDGGSDGSTGDKA